MLEKQLNNTSSFGNDMFMLLTSIMWLNDPETMIDMFVDSVNSFSNGFSIEFYRDAPDEQSEMICLGTDQINFGYFKIVGDLNLPFPELSEIINNSIHMLAVLLERVHSNNMLSDEKLLLQDQVDQVTESLAESEQRYSLAMQAANDGMFDLNVTTGEVIFSDRWYTMLGYEPGELPNVYATWKSLLPPEMADEIENELWRVMESQEHWEMEFQMLRKDGRWAWILARGQIIKRDDGGYPVRIIGTHIDITARKNAERELDEYKGHLEELVEDRAKELKLLNQRYNLALDATGTGVWEWDPRTDITVTNEAWLNIFGFNRINPGEDYGKFWINHVHPEDRGRVAECLQKHVDNELDMFDMEYRYQLPERDWIWLHVVGRAVERDSNGKALRVIGICNDVTDQKNIDLQLKLKNKELAETVEQLQATQSQLVLFEKMAALKHLIAGIAHEINTPLGAISSSREVILTHLSGSADAIPRLAKCLEGPYGDVVKNIITNSFVYNVDDILMSSRDKRLKRYEIIDILEKNGVEDAEIIACKLVEMRIYKDINQLLPMLKDTDGYDILSDIAKIVDSVLACETIKTAVTKASKTVMALNNYIRRGDGSSSDDGKTNIDLRMSIDNVLVLFHNSIKRNVSLNVVYDEDLPEIYGNCDELNQVWTNIIQNALQAMESNGRLGICVTKFENGVQIDITDNGCGMTPEVKEKMFEPLYTTKPAGEGTGLGMDIVRKIIVEHHNGKITVDSEYGIGTTIGIWLPIGKTDGSDLDGSLAEKLN